MDLEIVDKFIWLKIIKIFIGIFYYIKYCFYFNNKLFGDLSICEYDSLFIWNSRFGYDGFVLLLKELWLL